MTGSSTFSQGSPGRLNWLGKALLERTSRAEQSHPPIGEFVMVDGKRVHFSRQGSGPALILIHGAGGNLRDFTFQLADKLARHNTVIAFDRPGHGYTDAIHARGETPAEQAELLDQASRAIGLKRAAILGYSLGGAVALAWALARPEFVKSLLLVSAVTHPWPGGVGLLYGSAANPLTSGLVVPAISALARQSLVETTLYSVFHPNLPPEGYLDYIGAGLSLRPHSLRANARQAGRLKYHMSLMAPKYPTLNLPIEILHGSEDRTVYASIHAVQLQRDAPNAHYTPLPGIGHAPHHHSHLEIIDAVHRLNTLRN